MPLSITPQLPWQIPERPVSRLAPTPSGFLHMGNAVNFLVTWALVRSHGGSLALRIDDMDGTRFRREVLDDIFISLDWLGLDWDRGPDGPDDFVKNFSLQARKSHYREQLRSLEKPDNRVFACGCSRRTIKQASPSGLYPGTCRYAGCSHEPGQNAVRLRVDKDSRIRVNGRVIDLARTFGDFVLWRRDDQPSYQLASLVEDEEAQMSLIVRGEDLIPSTAAQLYLAHFLGFTAFPSASFIHHSLIMGKDGQKLSKSRGAYALKDMRESGQGPAVAVNAAAEVLGLTLGRTCLARDLVSTIREKMAN